MYVKRHAVVKGGRRYVYLRLVEAYRDADGRVRHRVLRTLGREDELKASGQLEQLAASFARSTRRRSAPAATSGRCCWWPTTCGGWAWSIWSTTRCRCGGGRC